MGLPEGVWARKRGGSVLAGQFLGEVSKSLTLGRFWWFLCATRRVRHGRVWFSWVGVRY